MGALLIVKSPTELNAKIIFCMGLAMQKRVFEHMRTVMAQISLRLRAVWSGPSVSTNRISGNIERMNGEQRLGSYFMHAQDDLNLRILRMFEGTFSLD